jgi:hypothetical protein
MSALALSFASEYPGAIKDALNESGWFDEPVVAAGQLRQGTAPSMAQMLTGAALIEVLRPRRSKLLPRHFVLALTADRAIAFKALGGGPKGGGDYILRVKRGEEASFPRASLSLTDLPEGASSKGGTMTIDGKSFPVSRPNLAGDPDTTELIGLLAQ